MDLVSQIVATKGNVEMEEFQQDLNKLASSTQVLKRSMMADLNNQYTLRSRYIMRTSCFTQPNFERYNDSLETLQKRIKEMKIDVEEKCKLKKDLEDINKSLTLLEDVSSVDSTLLIINNDYKSNLKVAAVKLATSKDIVKLNHPACAKDFGHFFQNASVKIGLWYGVVKSYLLNKWDEAICFTCENGIVGHKVYKLNILLNTSPSLPNLFHAISTLGHPITHEFGESLMKHFLRPAILGQSKVNCCKLENVVSITLIESKSRRKSSLMNTIESLLSVLDVLNSKLNFQATGGFNFIASVGAYCKDEFVSLLTQRYLSKPTDHSDKLVELCGHLLNALMLKKFILKGNPVISSFEKIITGNLDMYSHCVSSAVSIIEKCLLDSSVVDTFDFQNEETTFYPISLPSSTFLLEESSTLPAELTRFFNISEMHLTFPSSRVSNSIFELIELLEDMLSKSIEAPSSKASLWGVVMLIVNLYLDSPTLHLASPLYSALIYNNSMYLAVQLILLAKKYEAGLPFSGLLLSLQNLAINQMSGAIDNQLSTIMDTLKKSGLEESFDVDNFPEETTNSIKECAKLLEDVHSLWENVLPSEILNMVLGYLSSRFFEEIIKIFSSAVKIKHSCKRALIALFSSIAERIGKLLKEEETTEKWKDWKKIVLMKPE